MKQLSIIKQTEAPAVNVLVNFGNGLKQFRILTKLFYGQECESTGKLNIITLLGNLQITEVLCIFGVYIKKRKQSLFDEHEGIFFL